MRTLILLTALALAGCHANPNMAAAPKALSTAGAKRPAAQQKAPQVLVKFQGRPQMSVLATFRATYGTRNVGYIAGLEVYVEELTGDKSLAQALKEMNADPAVEYAEANGEVTTAD